MYTYVEIVRRNRFITFEITTQRKWICNFRLVLHMRTTTTDVSAYIQIADLLIAFVLADCKFYL